MSRKFWCAILLTVAAPATALAQSGSTAGTLQLYATFEAIGARLPYLGDANTNATARLEWRRTGDAAWTLGGNMTRITNRRWAGSVLWLTPNTSYDVRAVIEDPDGSATSGVVAATTRMTPPSVKSGSTYWVAPNGNDDNDGSSKSPFATLLAAANYARAGDEVRVRPGLYYQTLTTPASGTATAPIHLVADGPGVILDGSDPAFLHRTDWRSDGGGVFSVPYTASGTRLVCADSLQRLYLHGSLSSLRANANGVAQGFAIEGGRLYVKLEDLSNPTGHTMHVARYNVGIIVDESWWHITGLEIRHFGLVNGGAGIQVMGAHSWIHDNHVHTLGGRGIFMRQGGADNLIERNLVRDPRVGTWPWDATKAHAEEITAISNRGGRGNVVRNNTVRGFFDGLDANDGPADEDVAADADYYGNLVTDCGDDAIETDTVSGINLRLWGNTFTNNFSGISIAPIYQGPEYVLYNVIADYGRGAFKLSLESSGHAWICHNTVVSKKSGSAPVWPSGSYSNLHWRNNVMIGNGLPAVNDEEGESEDGNDFDGDVVYSTSSTVFKWKDKGYMSVSKLRTDTGFEQNGRFGDPKFLSALSGDFRLLPGSLAIDAAIRIPGINDRFNGTAPDAGAFETAGASSAIDTTPPGTVTDLH